jgi:hypothetical protein
MNTGVDSELVKVVQEHVRKLSSDVATMSFESQEQINNVTRMLTNIQHGQKFGTVWLLTMRTTDQFCEFKMAEMLRINTIIIQMRCAC